MNEAEIIGYDYLQSLGYTEDDIIFMQFRSPDFVTRDGKLWEVKRVKSFDRMGSFWGLRDYDFTDIQLNEMNYNTIVLVVEVATKTVVEVPFYEVLFKLHCARAMCRTIVYRDSGTGDVCFVNGFAEPYNYEIGHIPFNLFDEIMNGGDVIV